MARDVSGRVLSLTVKFGIFKINLVNLYAPTFPSERKTFLQMVPSFFFPNTWPQVGGDFNCYDSVFDKFGGAPSLDSVFKGFKSGCRLGHVWRFKQMLMLKEITGSLGYLKWTKCFPYGDPDPCL